MTFLSFLTMLAEKDGQLLKSITVFIIHNIKDAPAVKGQQTICVPELYAHCNRIQVNYVYIKIYSTFNEAYFKLS